MQRILKAAPATLAVTFYGEELAVAADDDVTVTVVNEAGDVIVDAVTATEGDTEGTYTVAIDGNDIPAVDLLTATWTAEIGGLATTTTTQAEVVGGFFFELAEARASDSALVNRDKYPAALLAEVRSEVEAECEAITGVAWVPRYRRVRCIGTGTASLYLPDQQVRSIRSLSVDGVAFTEDELADLVPDGAGVVRRATLGTFLATAPGNVDVAYEHGYDAPPADLRRATLIRLKHRATAEKSGIPDRATSFVAGPGGTFSLATAGKGSSWTGIPEVDSAYDRHLHPRVVFA